ncbi:hypothetical protein MVEN_00248800 [Mycena venus]|uniref:Uncharacterized protein n=1 Tax=Mycena venus TaxID=2733690 RepID=A0A8H6Z1P7_9AGAR|nr:hypothetical protein MVEN_00248800 [Mycena venus]
MALWNFTIPDTSPIFSYHPYADGFGLNTGWQTYYTVSGFNTQPGESSEGDSYHVTSLVGAEVSLQFYGSAVYLYGTVNASYEVILDEDARSFDGATGVLYSNQALIEENHSAGLDPERMHTLNVTNISGGGKLTLSSVVTYQVDTSLSPVPNQPSNSTGPSDSIRGTSSRSVKVGKIVGPIAGVFVLGLLLAVFFWLRSRKPRSDNEKSITPLVLSLPDHGTGSTHSEIVQTAIPLRKGHSTWSQPALPPAPSPPTPLYAPAASAVSPTSPADVNQIIELIAQRIDRREGGQGSESLSPPGYRVHSM